MHLPSLLAVVAASVSASACTFGVMSEYHSNSADGSTGGSCKLLLWHDDLGDTWPWDGNHKNEFSTDLSCSKGCDTFEYQGRSWEVCHSILPPHKAEVTDATYMDLRQTDNSGDVISIWPGGEFKDYSSNSPFNSFVGNYFWRSGIGC
ncbi:hypothetical protein FE257_008622 [Aspergillus nanangensis]|uniref:Secreted protein n=1 Tax=Aspergillus nanangensis TaxID=2582783 RepID=A0AAD4CL23_ASPNN|nr:hypothetical protein FE257_008622 [Aspergillus nanangensis]